MPSTTAPCAWLMAAARVDDLAADVAGDPDLVDLHLVVGVDADFGDFGEVAAVGELERHAERRGRRASLRLPQPDFSRTISRTPRTRRRRRRRRRCWPGADCAGLTRGRLRMSSRNWSGSLPAACASSSMKDWNTNENALRARRAHRDRRHAERHERRVEAESSARTSPGTPTRSGSPPRAYVRAFAEGDEVVPPADELARLVEAGLQEVESGRAIVVVTHVVFARPQQLDRDADLLGDRTPSSSA